MVTTTIGIGLRAHLPHRNQMTYDAVRGRLLRAMADPGAVAAFLMTFVCQNWPRSEIERMLGLYARYRFVVEPWGCAAFKRAYVGAPVWLLRQGPGRKGALLGFGYMIASPRIGDRYYGKPRQMVDVRFNRFVDPERVSLVDPDQALEILGRRANNRTSGLARDFETALKLQQQLMRRALKPRGRSSFQANETCGLGQRQSIASPKP